MKYSIYNSLVAIGGSTLIYNGMSDKFVAVKRPITQVKCAMGQSPRNLKVEDAALYSRLTEIAAIVDDDADEVKTLSDSIHKIDNDESSFQLHINPTVDCTFRCWYCYEEHNRGSRMSVETVESVKKCIGRLLAGQPRLKRFNLSFFGGEPLMYFSKVAAPIVAFAKNMCDKHEVGFAVHFTTNAYLLDTKVSEFLGEIGCSLQVTLDGSREEHDKVRCLPSGRGSYDRILGNVRDALQNGCSVILRINYTRDNIGSVSEVIDDLASMTMPDANRLRVDFQQVWQDRRKDGDDNLDETVKSYMRRLKDAGIFGSKYYRSPVSVDSCYGDKRNHVLVNYNGDLFQCTARDFKREKRSGYLNEDGVFVWENDALERRMHCKFVRPVCHSCRIAPLCGGGCRTQALESVDRADCIYSYTDEQKDKIILDRFEGLFIKN